MAHHVVGERAPSVRKTPKEKAMIAERFVLAASMVVLVAMSGHAYAGSDIGPMKLARGTRVVPCAVKMRSS